MQGKKGPSRNRPLKLAVDKGEVVDNQRKKMKTPPTLTDE
jgi:hypothetical protein